jgi:hypothetical protein
VKREYTMLRDASRAAVPRSDCSMEPGEVNAVATAERSTARMTTIATLDVRHSDHADTALNMTFSRRPER